jgi:hypothetical protein
MDLNGLANQVAEVVNPNTAITIQASTGYTIGAGLKQVPSYAAPVSGFGQLQEITSMELKHLDGLNIQGEIQTIYITGKLSAVIRPTGQGGDLVTIGSQTWLNVKTLEQWPYWAKAAIVRQLS